MQVPQRQIRARFTDTTLTVHQAYPPEIAAAALAAGRFCPARRAPLSPAGRTGRHDRRDAELNSRVLGEDGLGDRHPATGRPPEGET